MSLNAAPITQDTTESAPRKILAEWLAGWFDGGTHSLGGATLLFPRCSIAFGQGEPVQPLDADAGAEIRTVMLPRGEALDRNTAPGYTGFLVTDRVLFQFWIQARTLGKGQSDHLAATVAQLLKAILAHPDARYPMNEKGIMSLRPLPPQEIPSADYKKRLVSCSAELQYGVTFGATGFTPANPAEQSQGFFQQDIFVTGQYLIGNYQWSVAMTALRASATALASHGAATVLELEINGVLTGRQIILPAAAANAQVTASVDLTGVAIPPNQAVRWKIVGGPADGESMAWQGSVALNVRMS